MQPAQRLADPASLPAVPLHIVLVEPQIPPNTGNVARLCAATGCALHLVEPLGFSIDDRELKRAGLDYWHSLDVVVHSSLALALERLIAPRWFFSTHAAQRYDTVSYQFGDALFFGKETAGLPRDLLAADPSRAVRIPMRPNAVRSINLSTAVGIAAYEALRSINFPAMT